MSVVLHFCPGLTTEVIYSLMYPQVSICVRKENLNVSVPSNSHLLGQDFNSIWNKYIDIQKFYFRPPFYNTFSVSYFISTVIT